MRVSKVNRVVSSSIKVPFNNHRNGVADLDRLADVVESLHSQFVQAQKAVNYGSNRLEGGCIAFYRCGTPHRVDKLLLVEYAATS